IVGRGRALEAKRAETGEGALLFSHLLARVGVRARPQERVEIRDESPAEAVIGGALIRQQCEGIGGAAPGERLVRQLEHIGVSGEMRECATHTFGADGRGHVAPPQRHVEIGVLATQELKANQATDGARAERPEKQWFSGAVEADDDKWLYTRIRPDMTLPLLVEVIILVGRGETVGCFQRAPVWFHR